MSQRSELRDTYKEVMDRIGEAAVRSGRRAEDIHTIAVTKYAAPDQIRQLVDLGHTDLGESRVQQLQQRVAMLDEFLGRRRMMSEDETEAPEIRWHMIGGLQRNKVRLVLPLVRLIHSVDSLRLAEEIGTYADRAEVDVEVLIQVNISGEQSKGGVAVAAAPHLGDQLQSMMHVKLRGLMTMAPHSDDGSASEPVFERCAELFEEMRKSGRFGRQFNILSMGMTNDFEQGISAGANVVRIGRAFFGEPIAAESP